MTTMTICTGDLSPEAEASALDLVRREFADARTRQAAEGAEAQRIAARLPLAEIQRKRLVAALQMVPMPRAAATLMAMTANDIDAIMEAVGAELRAAVVGVSLVLAEVAAQRYNELVAILKDEPVRPVYRAIASSSARDG